VVADRIENGLTQLLEKGTTIPDWGKKDLKAGTISAVCRQLGIDKNSL